MSYTQTHEELMSLIKKSKDECEKKVRLSRSPERSFDLESQAKGKQRRSRIERLKSRTEHIEFRPDDTQRDSLTFAGNTPKCALIKVIFTTNERRLLPRIKEMRQIEVKASTIIQRWYRRVKE